MDIFSELDNVLSSAADTLASALDAVTLQSESEEESTPDIFSRAQDILSRNTAQELSAAADPYALAEQMLPGVEADLDAAKRIAATFMAGEKDVSRRLDTLNARIAKYTVAAESAVRAGSDDDARKLLTTREADLAQQKVLQGDLEATRHASEIMQAVYKKLRQDQELLEARAASSMRDRAAAVAESARREAEERSLLGKYSHDSSPEAALRAMKDQLGM